MFFKKTNSKRRMAMQTEGAEKKRIMTEFELSLKDEVEKSLFENVVNYTKLNMWQGVSVLFLKTDCPVLPFKVKILVYDESVAAKVYELLFIDPIMKYWRNIPGGLRKVKR